MIGTPVRRSHLACLAILGAACAIVLLGGQAGADSFDGYVQYYWYECYDMHVGSTDAAVNIDLEARAPAIGMYDPTGAEVEMFKDVDLTGKIYSFVPAMEGRYSFLVMGGNSTLSYYQGSSTHRVELRTHFFDGLIVQDQNITYRFLVDDVNVPLVFCIDWPDDWDRIYPNVYDPDLDEMDISLDGHYSESVYTIRARRPGVYTVVKNGVRIESRAQTSYNASANYPFFKGKETDLDDDGGSVGGWLLTGAIGLVLVGVIAVVFCVLLRSGRLTGRATVEEDYSYPISNGRTPGPPLEIRSPRPSPGQPPGGQVPPWADPRQRTGAPPRAPRPPPPPSGRQGSQVQGIGTGTPPPAPGETRCVSCGRSFGSGTIICPYCGLPR